MSNEDEIAVRYELDQNTVWEKIKSRKAVFLDTNIWINMADGKAEAHALKTRLQERVRSGAVFCPLSAPLIWELYKQEFSELRTGALMEELSLNVTFAQEREIHKWELECFAKRLAKREDDRCSPKMLYVSAVAYLASAFTLSFPADTPASVIEQMGSATLDRMNTLTLTQLLTMRKGQMRKYLTNLPSTPYQQKAQELQAFAKKDREKVLRVEQETIFRNNVMPGLRVLPVPLQAAVVNYAQQQPKDKYDGSLGALFKELPSLHNYAEVMACASADPNRKDKASDFFDLEMMPVPLAYARAFITLDKWMRSRFLEPGNFIRRNDCNFYASYAELENWLEAL